MLEPPGMLPSIAVTSFQARPCRHYFTVCWLAVLPGARHDSQLAQPNAACVSAGSTLLVYTSASAGSNSRTFSPSSKAVVANIVVHASWVTASRPQHRSQPLHQPTRSTATTATVPPTTAACMPSHACLDP